jgi:lipopolysaccharide/colanic/teichoic acid biosynthesis glycosyltransferase
MRADEVVRDEQFARLLRLERSRTERSYRPFVLALVESTGQPGPRGDRQVLETILDALSSSTRDIDVKGWYRDEAVVGVIFTGLGRDQSPAVECLSARLADILGGILSGDERRAIRMSFHVYPDDSVKQGAGPFDPPLHRDLELDRETRRAARILKRSIDIAVGLVALVLLSPLLLGIAMAIKLTSRGPAFFRQERVGLRGRRFTFLKFRTMYFPTDPAIHEAYTSRLIAGTAAPMLAARTDLPVYKLANDSRITPLGRVLRRMSLDELPQLVNVLAGSMSLVGPRPCIPYEFDRYSIWQRRRVLGMKPGITGLWQVSGRGSVKFDEMVRLDLRYASTWSLRMDLGILWRTTRVVLSGEGAY